MTLVICRRGRSLLRNLKLGFIAVSLAASVGCAPDYSPNTYAANAVQQANKVEPAVVVGFRQVAITANGTVGAVTGGAAGGILGSQAGGAAIGTALAALGGTAVGSVVGNTVEHATGDTTGWEYIVRKPNGDLLSVTQREPQPLPVGQKVLVITGNQARIIPDYSVAAEPTSDHKSESKAEAEKPPANAGTTGSADAPHVAAPDHATPVPVPGDSATALPARGGSSPATPSASSSDAGTGAAVTPVP
jgi:outer membrane lipoprotein SlyB